MSIRAVIYAYIIGGLTFVPLLIAAAIAWTVYTSVPIGDPDPTKLEKRHLVQETNEDEQDKAPSTDDVAKTRKGWLTVRRTFEEKAFDGSYVNLMRNFLDSRSKDPKRSRPRDMWYVVLKASVLYLYEDEAMTECEAAIQVPSHEVVIAPEDLQDGELFTKRNAICLKPLGSSVSADLPSITKQMGLQDEDVDEKVKQMDGSDARKQAEKDTLLEAQQVRSDARDEAFDQSTPWFIFVRSCVDMEDWYLALVHAANYSSTQSTLEPVAPVFSTSDMLRLVTTLDDQPDVIPMRWLNALVGRLFFSFYRTQALESYIIGRLMKKLSKVKTPSFLQNIKVTEVSVGNMPPSFSKPMLKELTKEGDAALEIKLAYKGEIRLTVEATAIISLGQRFRTYTVKLVLAVVLRKLDGNLLVKVKRPPSSRIWYAFTQPPEMELSVEPVVSERQIKWGMILGPIESVLRDVIKESVVMPNMDDIAFFESSQYHHRGGIWADAQRKERFMDELLHSDKIASTSQKAEAGDANARKAQSTDAVLQKADTLANNQLSVDNKNMAAAAYSEKAEISSQASHSRHTSIHSIVGAKDYPEEQEPAEDKPSNFLSVEEGRGRSSQADSSTRRARSVPASSSPTVDNSSSALVDSLEPAEDDGSMPGLSTSVPGTSSMQVPSSSRTRSLSSTAKLSVEPSDGSELSTSSRETASNKASNTSSFLANLKSKGVDKQALSNTAKEAMRKWSANWTGFKREHMGGSNSSETVPDGDGAQPQGGLSLFAPTKRANYADIRAAVAGRREKVHSPNADDGSDAGSSTSNNLDYRKSYDADEAGSSEGPSTPLRSATASRSASPSTSAQLTSPFRKDSIRAVPIPPKVTTDVHVSDAPQYAATQSSSARDSFTPVPPPPPPIQAVPIKVQPSQGASMTIPGIHASHRNEVMSMGYAPPTPLTPTTPDPKARAPTIQSVYRLFKTPSGNSTSSGNGGDAGSSGEAGNGDLHTDKPDEGVLPSRVSISGSPDSNTATPTPTVETKRTPPPLPPRSNSKPFITPASSESATSGSENSHSASSSASDALKLIATQDDEIRKAVEGAGGEVRRRDSLVQGRRISLFGGEISEVVSEQERRGTLNALDVETHETTASAADIDKPSNKPTPPPLPPRREQSTIA